MTNRRRATVAALAVAVAVVAPAMALPATGQAAAYRYWSYWLGTDAGWSFASVGPSFRIPADGTLEGWRFSVSGVQGNHAPSMAADFEAVCGATPAEDGRKRVAIVVDPGVPADAPEGEQPPGAWAMCVVAGERATGYDVLRAAATVRAERGLICGIGGYPARGCADVIADPTPSASSTPSPSASATASKTPKPSRTPEQSASAAPTPSATASSTPAQVTSDPAPQASSPSSSAPSSRTAESSPPASPTATTSPSPVTEPTPSATAAAPAPASPSPSYSLLTAPLESPPSDGGGPGAAIVAGIAVVGIAGLGGAAILRMRRSSP